MEGCYLAAVGVQGNRDKVSPKWTLFLRQIALVEMPFQLHIVKRCLA